MTERYLILYKNKKPIIDVFIYFDLELAPNYKYTADEMVQKIDEFQSQIEYYREQDKSSFYFHRQDMTFEDYEEFLENYADWSDKYARLSAVKSMIWDNEIDEVKYEVN